MSKSIFVAILFYVGAVLCCTPGDRRQLQNECYALCTDGYYWVIKGCKDTMIIFGSTTACEENTVYKDYHDPGMYFLCENGVLSYHKCENGEEFDKDTLKCVNPEPPDLDVRNRIITKQDQCIHGETRKKEGSCKQYYVCKNGTESLARCLDCQNYDETEKKCRYVFNAPCHSPFPEPPTTCAPTGSTEDPGRTTDPLSSNITTSVTETSTSSDIGASSSSPTSNEVSTTEMAPNGPDTPHSDSSDPGSTTLPYTDCKHRRALPDCKYYLECHEGELVTRRCGWLQYFDSLSNSCSFMGYTCYGSD